MKECFKCSQTKELNEFYAHKRMSDGHLNKCKDCTKKDVRDRYYDPESRERIRIYEQNRFKKKERKEKIRQYQMSMRHRDPKKSRIRQKTTRWIREGKIKKNPCEVCGDTKSQAHHLTYDDPLDIKWLCFKHHREQHGQIVN